MSIFKSGLKVSIFTLISRLAGFARDIFISSALGAGISSDIFNIAFRLPNFFRRIFAEGAFNAAFIPIYNDKINNRDESTSFANQTLTILTICLVAIIIFIELFLPLVMYILAPGFQKNSPQWNEAINLCRISMPYLLFISIVSFFGAILNSHGRYGYASSNSILFNIVLILCLMILDKYLNSALYALVLGIIIAGICQLIFMILPVKKENLLPKFVKPNITIDIKILFKKMFPGIIAGGVLQINILVDQAIASFLESGSISYLSYADRINQLPLSLIGTAIGTVLLPTLSKIIKNKDREYIYEIQNRALEIGLLLSLPASFALCYLSEDIILVLFKHGAFTYNDAINTSKALAIFALGLPAYVMVKIFAPSFFANGDTKTPLKISLICLLSNIMINILLVRNLSYISISIATVVSAWLNSILMFYSLKNKNIVKIDVRVKKVSIKILICCALMLLILKIIDLLSVKYLYIKIYSLKPLLLLLQITLGGLVFIFTAYNIGAFNIKEIKSLARY